MFHHQALRRVDPDSFRELLSRPILHVRIFSTSSECKPLGGVRLEKFWGCEKEPHSPQEGIPAIMFEFLILLPLSHVLLSSLQDSESRPVPRLIAALEYTLCLAITLATIFSAAAGALPTPTPRQTDQGLYVVAVVGAVQGLPFAVSVGPCPPEILQTFILSHQASAHIKHHRG